MPTDAEVTATERESYEATIAGLEARGAGLERELRATRALHMAADAQLGEALRQAEQLRGRVADLERAAIAMLGASALGVSEQDGIVRAQRLADLVGYRYDAGEKPAPIERDDVGRATAEASRLARALSAELEVEGGAWAFALFLFSAPAGELPGHVIQVSRDRDRTLLAVARWVKDSLEAKGVKPKARG